MAQNKKGYIYKYTFPNGKVYIGQTKRDVSIRHKQHMAASKEKYRCRLCEKAIAEYGEPLLEVVETIEVNDNNEEELNVMLNDAERKWIAECNSENPNYGYNARRGGKRDGAGRKPIGISTKALCVKFDLDLYEIFSSRKWNKNRYINAAVREKMKNDGLI